MAAPLLMVAPPLSALPLSALFSNAFAPSGSNVFEPIGWCDGEAAAAEAVNGGDA